MMKKDNGLKMNAYYKPDGLSFFDVGQWV